jgi:hypothetical protein
MDLAPGLYKYSIIAENEAGFSKRSYFEVLVGEKCDITFQLRDFGGDGWKGAAISVTSEAANGQRIAVITMTEGSIDSITVPLLKGNLNFIWNHGWYHLSEGYDTDYECSFMIFDDQGNELFVGSDLEDGVFMTHENDCEHVGTSEVVAEKDIHIYPNPTDGLLKIDGQGAMNVSVFNMLGQEVMHTQAEGQATIDLGSFGSGVYMIRVETSNGVSFQKVNLAK